MVVHGTRSQIVECVHEGQGIGEPNEKCPARLKGWTMEGSFDTLRSTAHLVGTRVTFGVVAFPSGRHIFRRAQRPS
jgi:hypothetical protein